MEPEPKKPARILAIAGSDSGGGAGIQADIKTITTLGGYAMTALTALTAQNTQGVQAILPVPPEFLRAQIRSVLDDLGADAIKTGMLGGAAEIQCVCEEITRYRKLAPTLPVVIDPVMIAKGGASLLAQEALSCLKTQLFPLATLLTPNLPEAEKLTGMTISSVEDMRKAASVLRQISGATVLVKGGHLTCDGLVDVLLDADGFTEFSDTRIATRHTHGTGCTLASALAVGLAQKLPLRRAVEMARLYVRQAILTAPGLGAGAGPLWHAHDWYESF
ncbi:bifunctional hydroxymethylpyrimidine kinase/phosphomethylpyrimidine kinase [Acetobacter orleanensis]|uniref:hydroxymethylpyrimidine kinase n=1 Tax=Acetobacter orleanensis TaxID=104099 RepID=A0A4Y3TKZ8_9PROT|nr:bifunctional hydroxymethylpyrimidine kinase/phosphomethylpyrimidine kinase [Acetobacter orleanensis]KXV62314.1 phosphomethylpyrimidine kinase [Acetobacter orleanensis]PCD79469.1 bifunctional hydroxymethylpyrimidine kinase/phosphomethylpyrimidine kinase [Acetobacter orleanensis]GAN69133.1 phosphomethylpyrimidine kinase [Acetobacter orleanensis JCM 7639]GEB82602.1 hydroxymethylpyrimidine/phosphomethylpyrimidine kinase [Acetobacter orleanensis]